MRSAAVWRLLRTVERPNITKLTHVNLSKSSLCRLVRAYGQELVGLQAAEAIVMVQVPKAEAEIPLGWLSRNGF